MPFLNFERVTFLFSHPLITSKILKFEISSDQKVHLGSAATKIGKFCRPAISETRETLVKGLRARAAKVPTACSKQVRVYGLLLAITYRSEDGWVGVECLQSGQTKRAHPVLTGSHPYNV